MSVFLFNYLINFHILSLYLISPYIDVSCPIVHLTVWVCGKYFPGCFYISAQVQRALQLRIEEHARYLQKILDEQQKAGITWVSPQNLSSKTDPCHGPELRPSSSSPPHAAESKTEASSPLASKHKATDISDSNSQLCSKRIRLEEKEESGPDRTAVGDAVH